MIESIAVIAANGSGLQQSHPEMILEKEQQIPAAIQYHIKRYMRNSKNPVKEGAQLVYKVNIQKPAENNLQLKFCVTGNIYCSKTDCNKCTSGKAKDCERSIESTDFLNIKFSPIQLSPFVRSRVGSGFDNATFNFEHKSSFKRTLPLCCKIKSTIESLLSNQYTGSLENIYINTQLQMLLLYSMDCIADETAPEEISCKFLANAEDKAKVAKARDILITQIGSPITIKELSRKVAINQCYLKKGFKELYGTTIFDFYQTQRMEHAKYLLYEKGLSVTDVSLMLGYSSISHFSTAFKKQTGLKPCELLFR